MAPASFLETVLEAFSIAGWRIKEVPIPTYYGDEICRVNGLKYAFDVLRSVFLGGDR